MADQELSFKDALLAAYDQEIKDREASVNQAKKWRADIGEQLSSSDEDKQKFHIVVESLWKGHGEKGSNGIYEGSLKYALRMAIEKVRMDGQCHVESVLLVLPNIKSLLTHSGFAELKIPKEVWVHHLPESMSALKNVH